MKYLAYFIEKRWWMKLISREDKNYKFTIFINCSQFALIICMTSSKFPIEFHHQRRKYNIKFKLRTPKCGGRKHNSIYKVTFFWCCHNSNFYFLNVMVFVFAHKIIRLSFIAFLFKSKSRRKNDFSYIDSLI